AALDRVGDRPCVLDAQTYLRGFYERLGFAVTGPEFLDDGVPHVPMRRATAGSPPGRRRGGAGRGGPAPPRGRAGAPATRAGRASGRRSGAARRPRTRASTRSRPART